MACCMVGGSGGACALHPTDSLLNRPPLDVGRNRGSAFRTTLSAGPQIVSAASAELFAFSLSPHPETSRRAHTTDKTYQGKESQEQSNGEHID